MFQLEVLSQYLQVEANTSWSSGIVVIEVRTLDIVIVSK